MPKRLLLVPTQCRTHGELCGEMHAIIAGTFEEAGWEVASATNPSDLMPSAHLLLLGLGEWGMDRHGPLLRAAGRLGIRRSIWQLETLPPPDLPDGWLSKFLLRKAPDRTTGITRFLERLGYQHLMRQCRHSAWNQVFPFEGRRLGLPIREGRKLIGLWQEGLIDQILVSQLTRQQFLASRAVPSRLIPFGHHPRWGRPLPGVTRDFDVVFLGSLNNRRSQLLAQIRDRLSRRGYGLTIVDQGCYGEARLKLLNRAKIILYLRGHPWEMPRMRLLMAMGCKAMVVAEDFPDTYPFRPGEHLAMAAQRDLADTLLTYLTDEEARQRVADTAYSLLVAELGMGKTLIPAISGGYPQKSA